MKYRTFVRSDFSPMFTHFSNLVCNRVRVMNLPEEIDDKFLIYHVLMYGRVLFFEHKGKYHVFYYSGRGHLNEYYIQDKYLVTNPRMSDNENFTKEFTDENSAVIFSNTTGYLENSDTGLLPLVEKYSELIETIDKSIEIIVKNARLIAIFTGNDNAFIESARIAIATCFKGESPFVIMEESLIDNIKVNPISEHMDYKLSELIKARQYYISDFYQKIGISANQNMKKERLTDNESQLIDTVSSVDFKYILDNLNSSVEKVNKMFGLNIVFELNEDEDDDEDENEDEDDTDNLDKENGNENDSVQSEEKEEDKEKDKGDEND